LGTDPFTIPCNAEVNAAPDQVRHVWIGTDHGYGNVISANEVPSICPETADHGVDADQPAVSRRTRTVPASLP
jgi:hypothetical protein